MTSSRPWYAIFGSFVGCAFCFTARLYLGTGWLWWITGFVGWIVFGFAGLAIQLAKDGTRV